jgi:integrase
MSFRVACSTGSRYVLTTGWSTTLIRRALDGSWSVPERQALAEAWRDHGLVFASSIGMPVEPRNVNRRWDELRRRAGLDWLRLHDLRHGCATLPAGHAQTTTSLDHSLTHSPATRLADSRQREPGKSPTTLRVPHCAESPVNDLD